MPGISVIVPVYNTERYLEECLQSVLSQDFQDVEIFCVDDGSTDGSRAILDRYNAMDARVHVLAGRERRGPSFARNRALDQATGMYIYFLDSDDMIPPHALRKIYDAAEKDDLDGVMFNIQSLFEGDADQAKFHSWGVRRSVCAGVSSGRDLYVRDHENGELVLATCTACWRRAFLEEHHLRFRKGVLHEDYAFAFRAILLARRMRALPMDGYVYRRRPNSITTREASLEDLLGWMAVYADEMCFLLEHAQSLGECFICMVLRDLREMMNAYRPLLLAACHMHPEKLREVLTNDVFLQIPYDLFLRHGYRYLKGYLTGEVQHCLESHDAIIVYGAGKIGREVINLLEEYGIQNYRLAVTARREDAKGLIQMATELRALQFLRKTAIVLVSAGKNVQPQMLEEAERLGFQNVVSYDEIM